MGAHADNDEGVPPDFLCPISLEVMRDPVTLQTGQTYDRHSIQRWLSMQKYTCPVTMQALTDLSLTPNTILQRLIAEWAAASTQGRASSAAPEDQAGGLDYSAASAPWLLDTLLADTSSLLERKSAGTALLALLHAENPAPVEHAVLQHAAAGAAEKLPRALLLLAETTQDPAAVLTGLNLLKSLFVSQTCKGLVEKHIESWVSILLHTVLPECSRTNHMQAGEVALEILDMVSVQEAGGDQPCYDQGRGEMVEKGKDALFNSPITVASLSAVIMKGSERCSMYAVLILLEMAKKLLMVDVSNFDEGISEQHPFLLLVSRPSGTNAAINSDYSTNANAAGAAAATHATSSYTSTTFFMSSGLPRKLLLVLQSNCSPALKKRCAELLKILDNSRRQAQDARRILNRKHRPPPPRSSSSHSPFTSLCLCCKGASHDID